MMPGWNLSQRQRHARGRDAVAAVDRSDAELRRIAEAGRERVLSEHTANRRAAELLAALGGA